MSVLVATRGKMIESDMAWSSESRPGKIRFDNGVRNDIAATILSSVGEAFPIAKSKTRISLKSLRPATDPAGHYLLYVGRNKWFLRVSRRHRKSPELEDIASFYIANSGLRVNLPISSRIDIPWGSRRYTAYVFPFLDARHFDGSDKDLICLGKAVRRMHEAFRHFKFANLVRVNALNTARRLAKTKEEVERSIRKGKFSYFRERSGWAKANSAWLKEMVKRFNPYLCLMSEAQCVHGELHLGNVLFSNKGGAAILTDFEEVSDSYFPPSFDIAYLTHRFCMDAISSKNELKRRFGVLEEAYGRKSSGLFDMMRQVSWYNIALIIDRLISGESITPVEEYEKFVRLKLATERFDLERCE